MNGCIPIGNLYVQIVKCIYWSARYLHYHYLMLCGYINVRLSMYCFSPGRFSFLAFLNFLTKAIALLFKPLLNRLRNSSSPSPILNDIEFKGDYPITKYLYKLKVRIKWNVVEQNVSLNDLICVPVIFVIYI